jgi:hypothetical protein
MSDEDKVHMKQSDDFRSLLQELSFGMTARPGLAHFGDARAVSTVIHGLANLAVSREEVGDILAAVDADADWLVKTGNPHDLAMLSAALATLYRGRDASRNASRNASRDASRDASNPKLFDSIMEHAAEIAMKREPHSIAKIAMAFGEFDLGVPDVLRRAGQVGKRGDALSRDINGRILANEDDWRGILSVYRAERDNFNSVNWATAITKLGRLGFSDKQSVKQDVAFRDLLSDLSRRMTASSELHSFGGVREVANIMTGLANLGVACEDILDILVVVDANASWLVKSGQPRNLTSISKAFFSLRIPEPHKAALSRLESLGVPVDLNKPILGEVQDWRRILPPHAAAGLAKLSNETMTAIVGRLGELPSADMKHMVVPENYTRFQSFLRDLAARMTESPSLRDFGDARAVSSVVLGLGRLKVCVGKKAAKVLAAVDADSEWLVREGQAADVAAAARGFALLNTPAPALFKEIDEHSAALVKSGSSKDVADLAWATVKLGVPSRALFREIDEHLSTVVENGELEHLALLAVTYGKIDAGGALFKEIDEHVAALVAADSENVSRANLRHVSSIAFSLATSGITAPLLLQKLEELSSASPAIAENALAADIGRIAWAFATLNVQAPALFANIDKHAARALVEKGTPVDVANAAWAFATLDLPADALVEGIRQHSRRLVAHKRRIPRTLGMLAWACNELGGGVPAAIAAELSKERREKEKSKRTDNKTSK